MSRAILLVVVMAVTSCATEGPEGPGSNIDGKADGWGTTDTPCDLCLRDYYACSTCPGEIDACPMSTNCWDMFNLCVENEVIDVCEALEAPLQTCLSCQDSYDICLLDAPSLDSAVCQSEFVDCVSAGAIEAWCAVDIECDQCMGLYASCMQNSADGTECLGLFGDCVNAGGLNDWSCAPVWEPGFDQCDECQGDYATCMETTGGTTCLNDFGACVNAAGIGDGSCAPLWEPGDPCDVCTDGLSICLTEVRDAAFCRTEFDQCAVDEGAAGCEITCGLCQDLQISCENNGGDFDTCIDELFSNCFTAGGLSSDTCSPAYD